MTDFSQCKALWRAVIDLAMRDAIGPNGYCSERDTRRARLWFEGNSADMQLVCALADLEPDYVRRAYRESKKLWRTEPKRYARKPWTTDDDTKLRRLWRTGKTGLEIGEVMRRSKGSVLCRARELELAGRR